MLGRREPGPFAGAVLQQRYRVLEPISRGAMGAVWRALDTQTGQEVAVKQLLDAGHAHRFEAEARLLASLSHPRVVKVLDHFAERSAHYLVMELVRGTDLGDVLRRRGRPGLPVDEAIGHTAHACEALQYVHDQQIVHRDVKPQNLIVSAEGVVLVDFGIARLLDDEPEVEGTVGVGTPRFVAPEVLARGAVSPRTDVFGVAATLWTLLTGRPPVYADTTPLTELASGVTPELERAVRAGLDPSPERRFASVAAFASALGARVRADAGASLATSIESRHAPAGLMETIVRAAGGVFGASAASLCLVDEATGELVYQSAWGAAAQEIVGVRLPLGTGIAGGVVKAGVGEAVGECRHDPRFAVSVAQKTGYVPFTMLVVPLLRGGRAIGALSLLDRRDGMPYRADDLERGLLFAELAVSAIEALPELGSTTDTGPSLDLTRG